MPPTACVAGASHHLSQYECVLTSRELARAAGALPTVRHRHPESPRRNAHGGRAPQTSGEKTGTARTQNNHKTTRWSLAARQEPAHPKKAVCAAASSAGQPHTTRAGHEMGRAQAHGSTAAKWVTLVRSLSRQHGSAVVQGSKDVLAARHLAKWSHRHRHHHHHQLFVCIPVHILLELTLSATKL